MNKKMKLNTKLEVAIEVLSAKIANASNSGLSVQDEEMQLLLKEREKLYSGDEPILDKIIEVYGKEIKKNYEEV